MKTLLVFLAMLLGPVFQDVVEVDRTVVDFGEISLKDGPQTAVFTFTNKGDEVMNIFAVQTTCSCTASDWTKKDIAPGASGTVTVTFSNDEGPYKFDKKIKVYVSTLAKPVALHIRGVVHE